MGAQTLEPRAGRIDEWFRWLHWVGGEGLLDEVCRADEVTYKFGGKPRISYTCGCGQTALGDLPYEDENLDGKFARVCAVCDAATQFPRFADL